MQNNRREHFQNVKRNSIKNVNGEPYDSTHSQRSSTRCQLFVANELNRRIDRKGHQRHCLGAELTAIDKGVNGSRNNPTNSGNDGATDGYETAQEESASEDHRLNPANVLDNNKTIRPTLPVYKFVPKLPIPIKNVRANYRYSSYSDDEDVKGNFRSRRGFKLTTKPAEATSKPLVSPVTIAQQNSADVSTFIQKKSLAQGMMDLALMSANTNQLRYILEYRNDHPYFLTSLCLVIGSLFLQLAVGLTLIWNTRFNVRKRNEMMEADRVNNVSVIAIFMITLINVFLSTFGGAPQAALPVRAPTTVVVTSSPAPTTANEPIILT